MKHGQTDFDRKYYKRFFKEYSKDELAVYYRWSLGWIRFLDRLLDLKIGRGRKVLEIGCSIGAFSKVLRKRGFQVIATDISPYIIKKAKNLQKDIDFRSLNIEEKINIRGNFDYIVAFEILEHLKDPEKAMDNIYEKLKKGGYLVFSTPFPTKRSLSDPTHINIHKENWWLNLGKKTGFRKRKVIHATFIPFLYRINEVFSRGFPIKTNLPLVNSTAFFIFEK